MIPSTQLAMLCLRGQEATHRRDLETPREKRPKVKTRERRGKRGLMRRAGLRGGISRRSLTSLRPSFGEDAAANRLCSQFMYSVFLVFSAPRRLGGNFMFGCLGSAHS